MGYTLEKYSLELLHCILSSKHIVSRLRMHKFVDSWHMLDNSSPFLSKRRCFTLHIHQPHLDGCRGTLECVIAVLNSYPTTTQVTRHNPVAFLNFHSIP
jgi:hypothetical protein